MRALRDLARAWGEWRRYQALPARKRRLTFFSEDVASWAFFEPVVRALTGDLGRDVAYLTSAPDDPRLTDDDPRLHAFYLGEGLVRTLAFFQLPGPVVVMTMPDLENLYLKRSRAAKVHYAYIFHSMNSAHMVYGTRAFDHYDSMLCVGPHHMVELRARESRAGLPARRLFPHGYARLDHLLATRPDPLPLRTDPTQVLVAPSWGPHGLLETRGVELTRVLVDAGYRVVVRPHPHTVKTAPAAVEAIRQAFGDHDRVALELDVASTRSLFESAVMVSDWSGAALEYAFGVERPVLFVDVPRKVNNPDYLELGVEPLEAVIREDLGRVISPDSLAEAPAVIEALLDTTADYPEHLAELRDEVIYSVGSSGAAGARVLVGLVDELK
jgi:YidC/Oxa1 family membrane protein insertase